MKLDLTNKLKVEIAKEDHVKVQGRIREILGLIDNGRCGFRPGRPNWKFCDPDWADPNRYQGTKVPLADESGELKYYVNIRNAIEMLLSGLNVDDKWLKDHRCPYWDSTSRKQ